MIILLSFLTEGEGLRRCPPFLCREKERGRERQSCLAKTKSLPSLDSPFLLLLIHRTGFWSRIVVRGLSSQTVSLPFVITESDLILSSFCVSIFFSEDYPSFLMLWDFLLGALFHLFSFSPSSSTAFCLHLLSLSLSLSLSCSSLVDSQPFCVTFGPLLYSYSTLTHFIHAGLLCFLFFLRVITCLLPCRQAGDKSLSFRLKPERRDEDISPLFGDFRRLSSHDNLVQESRSPADSSPRDWNSESGRLHLHCEDQLCPKRPLG